MIGALTRLVDSERFVMLVILAALAACAFVRCDPAPARAEGIPAYLAAGRLRVPTFDQLHRAYFRLVVNEGGFVNLADQDGILQSMLFGGGGRMPGRNQRGQGHGLDYQRLMRRFAAHSTRTFPADSPFLMMTQLQRVRLAKRQTRRNRWTSTLQLDCSEPEGWPETREDGSPIGSFRSHFGKRCRRLVETSRAFLRGEIETRCDGQPTTWGAGPDIYREGGPLESGWTEVFCHRVPAEQCQDLTRQEQLNSTTCAQNRFWNWL